VSFSETCARRRSSVVVTMLPEEPAHSSQDREWNHDRPENDERRRLIAGNGNEHSQASIAASTSQPVSF
jgi:hypothetical protein